MDEKTGEFLEHYSPAIPEVENELTALPWTDETYSSDFEWPEDDESANDKGSKRKYIRKEAARTSKPKLSKKPKKVEHSLQPPSKVKAIKPKSNDNGIFTVLALKSDLDNEVNLKPEASVWRRDGNELLRKYLRLQSTDTSKIFFISTPIYAIWEEYRRNEFVTVTVKCVELEDDSKVQMLDIDLEESCELPQDLSEVTEDSMISYDAGDGSFDDEDGHFDENCIIIEEVFEDED